LNFFKNANFWSIWKRPFYLVANLEQRKKRGGLLDAFLCGAGEHGDQSRHTRKNVRGETEDEEPPKKI